MDKQTFVGGQARSRMWNQDLVVRLDFSPIPQVVQSFVLLRSAPHSEVVQI